jgi:alkanesulfonate monooxygenase SsuD/methylene tetrahydromethanopterin reductase-like flavin-dependent oxidoreductase (luciferase family)
MGVDQNEARGRFDESLQVIRQLLATGQCDFDGEFTTSTASIYGRNRTTT